MKDPYAVLGVSRSTENKEIKKAYRKLASQLHPDKNPGKRAEQRFKEVTSAYEVLGDTKRRKLYDEFGELSLQPGFDPDRARAGQGFGGFGGPGGGPTANLDDLFAHGGGGGLGDMLGDLFRRTRGNDPTAQHHAAPAARGVDAKSTVKLAFVDAIRGTMLKLTPRGQGGESLTVRIPAGAKDGGRVRVKGKGAPGAHGGPPGDLLLTLKVSSHPYFKRDGADLLLDLPITIAEAYLGAQVRVPTPDGEVKLTVPAGTQSGDRLRLRGKGVERKKKDPGDMFVRFLVRYPTSNDLAAGVSEHDEKELGEALDLLGGMAFDPRAGIDW